MQGSNSVFFIFVGFNPLIWSSPQFLLQLGYRTGTGHDRGGYDSAELYRSWPRFWTLWARRHRLSLWLILITPALVGGSRIHSSSKEAALVGGSGVYGSSKEAVVMARGPVPSSSSSPCTHIGIGNGNDRPCPRHPWWWWWWMMPILRKRKGLSRISSVCCLVN